MTKFNARALYNAEGQRIYSVGKTPIQLYRLRGDLDNTGSQELVPLMRCSNLTCRTIGDIENVSSWVCDVEEYFAAITEFGALCNEFVPQSDWDNLDTSTKQNCSYVWADSIEELEALWLEHTAALVAVGY